MLLEGDGLLFLTNQYEIANWSMMSFSPRKDILKVAITGANGFLGSNLVKRCLKENLEVTGLVRDNGNLSLLPKDFKPISINYWDSKELEKSLTDQDVLIHCAAITRGRDWKDFQHFNVEMSSKLFQVANHIDSIKQIIFISSQAAAGMCNKKVGKREDEKCVPVSYYGKSKLITEEELMSGCEKNWTIIRPASVYGEGDKDFLQYFKLIKSGISLLIGMKPKYVSLIYIDDLVEMIFRTLGNEHAYNETFFASCSSFFSWNDFITALEEAMGKKSRRIRVPELLVYPIAAVGELIGLFTSKPTLINLQKIKEMLGTYWLCDNGKAKELLKLEVEGDLTENLKKTYTWYKEQKWL